MTIPGKIASDKILELKFAVSGKLTYLNCKLGDKVNRGQLLASLDKKELQAYLDRALKQYEIVRGEFDEKQNQNLSNFEKQKIQNELDISVKNVEIAKINIDDCNLYSPVAGTVVAMDPVEPGVNITPAGFVITVLDPKTHYFQGKAKEKDLPKIKINTEVEVTLTAFPGKIIKGKIERIGLVPSKEGIYPVDVSLTDFSELYLFLTGKFTI